MPSLIVCIMSCICNWLLCLNALSHLEQANGFSSFVCHVMPLQMIALNKCHVTLGTGKWLLICVYHIMHLQLVTLVKCLVTLGTS